MSFCDRRLAKAMGNDALTPEQRQRLAMKYALEGDVDEEDVFIGEESPAEPEEYSDDEIVSAMKVMNGMKNADQLEQKAALIAQKEQGIQDQAPFVRDAPRSLLKTIVGNAAVADSDPTVNQLVTATGRRTGVPKEVARFMGEDIESGLMSVVVAPKSQLTAQQQPNQSIFLPQLLVFRPYAIVQFGARGQLFSVEVDIGTGTQFAVPGSTIIVQVAMENNIAGDATIEEMNLGGYITPKATQKFAPVTRTAYDENIVDTAVAYAFVPPFAKRVYIMRSPESIPVDLIFGSPGTSGGVKATYTTSFAANTRMPEPIDLDPAATMVFVQNKSGAGATIGFVRIIFELEF